MTTSEFFKQIVSEKGGKISSKRVMGFASFILLVIFSSVDIATGDSIPQIIYYTFLGIVGAGMGFGTMSYIKDLNPAK